MGGIGSGHHRPRMRRIEETRRIDIRNLRCHDLLPDPEGDPSARVRRTLRYIEPMTDAPPYVSLAIGPTHVEARYGFRGKEVAGSVVLLRDTKNAARTFFACPMCGNRRELLYLLDSVACAACHRLRHLTQLMTPTERAIHRAEKLQELTGVPRGLVGAFDGLAPSRPPWLTPARWKAINAEYIALVEKTIGDAVAEVEKSVEAMIEAHGLPMPDALS